jgi:hypothetical protein
MTQITVPAVSVGDFDQELKGRLVEFLGTPAQLRGSVTDLAAFAQSEGVTVAAVSKLLRTDAGVKEALRSVALGGLFRVPAILQSLGDAAETGSIRAAEIYLDFIRKTLTDQQLMAAIRPEDSFEEMVTQAVSGAQLLLAKAKGRKVVVGVSVESGVLPEDGFRARGELSVMEGISRVSVGTREEVIDGVMDARVGSDAEVVSIMEPEKPRGRTQREVMASWEERNSS